MIKIIVYTTSAITLVLVIEHLFFYRTNYLSVSLLKFNSRDISFKNGLALFLTIVIPFSYAIFSHSKGYQKLLYLTIFLLLFFAIIYTFSRMGFLLALLSLILFVFVSTNKKPYIKQLTVVLTLLCIVFMFGGVKKYMAIKKNMVIEMFRQRGHENLKKMPSTDFFNFKSSRIKLINIAISGWFEKPIIGHGTMSFITNSKGQGIHPLRKNLPTHNDYAKLLYELGLMGILSFGFMFGSTLNKLYACRNYVDTKSLWLYEGQIVCLITLFASLFFINAYHIIPFWFVLAGSQITVNLMGKSSKLHQ